MQALAAPARCVGIAVVEPALSRAFPFRVKDVGAVAPLLAAVRERVPTGEQVTLVVEDDARLVALLVSVGASVADEVLHLEGPL